MSRRSIVMVVVVLGGLAGPVAARRAAPDRPVVLGTATASNSLAMIVPPRSAGAGTESDGQHATDATRRYLTDKVKQPPKPEGATPFTATGGGSAPN